MAESGLFYMGCGKRQRGTAASEEGKRVLLQKPGDALGEGRPQMVMARIKCGNSRGGVFFYQTSSTSFKRRILLLNVRAVLFSSRLRESQADGAIAAVSLGL